MFGGYAPFPMRLQPGKLDNVTAAQWVRASCTVAAALRAAPFCIAVVAVDTVAGTASVTKYLGRNGVGSAAALAAMTFTFPTLGSTTITPALSWVDEYGGTHSLAISSAVVRVYGNDADYPTVTVASSGSSLQIDYHNASETFVVILWAAPGDVNPRAYGADDDKRDCVTEDPGQALAEAMAQQVAAARGSQYTSAPTSGSMVAAETLALARGLTFLRRRREAAIVQRDPLHSDEAIQYWASIFGVNGDGNAWDLRKSLGSRWISALRGPSVIVNYDGLVALAQNALGPLFVSLRRLAPNATDSVSPWGPATPEAWGFLPGSDPIRNTGTSAAWDAQAGHWSPELGTAPAGIWTSDSCRLTLEVAHPAWMSMAEVATRASAAAEQLLAVVPSWVTVTWCTNYDAGFRLDLDPMDEVGMT